MKRKVLALLRSERGLTVVEYAIAGGLIAGAVVFAFSQLGQSVIGIIQTLITAMAP